MSLALVTPVQNPVADPPLKSVDSRTDRAGLRLIDELGPLLPQRTLRRGTSVGITGQAGKTSLLLRLLAGPMATGCWAAVIGLPELSARAADELGVPIDHLALVPDPGSAWLDVTAALLDALDIVVINPPRHCRPSDSRRLLARARQRHSVLVILDQFGWPESPDLILKASACSWQGLRPGHGALRQCDLTVSASGRRLNGPHRSTQLHLAAV